MYRYSADNAVTYTPDDLVLFRESPFAVWMERLTLENPEHGIPPDLNSTDVPDEFQPQDEIVATLRAEGRNVVQVDGNLDEASRRSVTLAAMRDGADFIVGGVLALDSLSGDANLLMRTSGYSALGDYLYIPCETRAGTALHSAFRLSFMADLLHSLQGQLPPQMLIIRDGADVQPLQTEDYIYYFRAVKQRFLNTMQHFRKHRMPDPAESCHFGRWSDCAGEVLKQRALRESLPEEDAQVAEEEYEEQAQAVQVASAAGGGRTHHDTNTAMYSRLDQVEASGVTQESGSHTLAEQARLLTPDSYRGGTAPGHTPNLARFGKPRPVSVVPQQDSQAPEHHRRIADASLKNLEFIGRGADVSTAADAPPPEAGADEDSTSAPPPNLREPPRQTRPVDASLRYPIPPDLPEVEPRAPVFLPPDEPRIDKAVERRGEPRTETRTETSAENMPAKSGEPPAVSLSPPATDVHTNGKAHSVIDMDSAPAPSLAPVVQRAEAAFERIGLKNPMVKPVDAKLNTAEDSNVKPSTSPFSNSLITSEEFDES